MLDYTGSLPASSPVQNMHYMIYDMIVYRLCTMASSSTRASHCHSTRRCWTSRWRSMTSRVSMPSSTTHSYGLGLISLVGCLVGWLVTFYVVVWCPRLFLVLTVSVNYISSVKAAREIWYDLLLSW